MTPFEAFPLFPMIATFLIGWLVFTMVFDDDRIGAMCGTGLALFVVFAGDIFGPLAGGLLAFLKWGALGLVTIIVVLAVVFVITRIGGFVGNLKFKGWQGQDAQGHNPSQGSVWDGAILAGPDDPGGEDQLPPPPPYVPPKGKKQSSAPQSSGTSLPRLTCFNDHEVPTVGYHGTSYKAAKQIAKRKIKNEVSTPSGLWLGEFDTAQSYARHNRDSAIVRVHLNFSGKDMVDYDEAIRKNSHFKQWNAKQAGNGGESEYMINVLGKKLCKKGKYYIILTPEAKTALNKAFWSPHIKGVQILDINGNARG